MNAVRLMELVGVLANVGVGLALFLGAGLLTKRSVAAASFMALAAFFQISSELVQRAGARFMMRYTPDPFLVFHLLDVVTLTCLFGALILAIRALPTRAA